MGQVFVRASRRAKAYVRGSSRIDNAVGGGGSKRFGAHAFEVTMRSGKKATIFRHGKYSKVASAVKKLQNKMKGGFNVIRYLP